MERSRPLPLRQTAFRQKTTELRLAGRSCLPSEGDGTSSGRPQPSPVRRRRPARPFYSALAGGNFVWQAPSKEVVTHQGYLQSVVSSPPCAFLYSEVLQSMENSRPVWYVYILRSLHKDYVCIGSTLNLGRRLSEHNGGKVQLVCLIDQFSSS